MRHGEARKGNQVTTNLVNKLEEFGFMLENGADADSRDILHALDRTMAEPLKFGPRGSTRADAWIATNGDPLASTEAARKLAGLVEPEATFTALLGPGGDVVTMAWRDLESKAYGASLPVAIVAAACGFARKVDGGEL
jgi:hypothetical protein